MNIIRRIFSTVLVFLLMFNTSNHAVNTDGEPDPVNDPQSAETVTQSLPQPSPDTVYPKKTDREYFRSVTETTTYDEILRDIGPADYITGSGIITYHWKLDDGSVANVTFNYDSQVMTLIIVKDGEASEMIVR